MAAGSDADVILLDPAVEHIITAAGHHSAMDTNVYEGKTIKGKVGAAFFAGVCMHKSGVLGAPLDSSWPPHADLRELRLVGLLL